MPKRFPAPIYYHNLSIFLTLYLLSEDLDGFNSYCINFIQTDDLIFVKTNSERGCKSRNDGRQGSIKLLTIQKIQDRSRIDPKRAPMCRLSAVGSKPQYTRRGPFAAASARPSFAISCLQLLI